MTVTLPSERVGDSALLYFPTLRSFPGLAHAITTKPWNMAPHRDADRDAVLHRRRQVCAHLGMPFDRLTAPDQIHSHHVLRVTTADVGAGRLGRETAMRFVDGLLCDIADTPILQLSGDCPMILVYDPRVQALGTAHASWRGTVAGITGKLVERMVMEFGSSPATLWAGIAPCAGGAAYEVGDDVRRVAHAMLPDAARFFHVEHGRTYFDLKAANAAQLSEMGVPPAQIDVASECTITDTRFYSHRREGPSTGRFALIAGIRAAPERAAAAGK